MAKMIVNANLYVKFKSTASKAVSFKDLNQVPNWATDVKTLAQYGIISGYEDQTLRPNSSITHAEALKIIDNALRVTGLIN